VTQEISWPGESQIIAAKMPLDESGVLSGGGEEAENEE
jgi:hypothetical protein